MLSLLLKWLIKANLPSLVKIVSILLQEYRNTIQSHLVRSGKVKSWSNNSSLPSPIYTEYRKLSTSVIDMNNWPMSMVLSNSFTFFDKALGNPFNASAVEWTIPWQHWILFASTRILLGIFTDEVILNAVLIWGTKVVNFLPGPWLAIFVIACHQISHCTCMLWIDWCGVSIWIIFRPVGKSVIYFVFDVIHVKRHDDQENTYALSLKNSESRLRSSGSLAASSLYGCGFWCVHNVTIVISATIVCKAMMKITESRKPNESYNKPLTDGPMNAPNAKVDVHKPDIRPYVSILSDKPFRLP